METQQEIVNKMRQALLLSDPDVDTTVGSAVRKILDAVAEVVAEGSVEQSLFTYQYDIDAKQGNDLTDFVKLFGYSRFPAKRASGMVLFERGEPTPETITIPLGTQLATEGAFEVVVQTITPALLIAGDTSIQVPVQAILGGANGNVPANSIRKRLTSFDGITSFTNPAALSGGADAEDDDQLRERFKNTIFRGMAGTEHMYLGIALDDVPPKGSTGESAVTHANVLGASKRFRENIEVISGSATSSQPAANIRHVYPRSSVVGVDIDNGDILTPDVHYAFDDTAIPPEINVLNAIEMPDGVYDFEYEYVPTASRNDPDNGVTNRVDIYVNGTRPTEANEVTVFDTAKVFNTTPGDPLHRDNFRREDGVTKPTNGNRFLPYAFGPVLDPAIGHVADPEDEGDETVADDVISIDGDDYLENTDFWLVNDITNLGGTPSSLSGIEFRATGSPLPADNDIVFLNYLFNAVPRDIELAVRQWRLVTTDARVHQALPLLLNLYMAVIFEQGYPVDTVTPAIETELERHIASVGFNQVVQISDLLSVVQNVDGVDAARFLTSADDATDYAIQRVSPTTGAVITTYDNGGTPKRAIDVVVGDSQYPVFNAVVIEAKAQNSFGSV